MGESAYILFLVRRSLEDRAHIAMLGRDMFGTVHSPELVSIVYLAEVSPVDYSRQSGEWRGGGLVLQG